jgi:hypothetical protein
LLFWPQPFLAPFPPAPHPPPNNITFVHSCSFVLSLCLFLILTPPLQLPLQLCYADGGSMFHLTVDIFSIRPHSITSQKIVIFTVITVRNWNLPQNVSIYWFLSFLFLLPPHGTPASSLACLRTSSPSLQRNLDLTTTSVGKVTGLEWVYIMVTTDIYSLNRILYVKWIYHYTMASSDDADIGDIIQVWRAAANTVNR